MRQMVSDTICLIFSSGGAFWLESELFLMKTGTLSFDSRASRGTPENHSGRARPEKTGCGEDEFPPRTRFHFRPLWGRAARKLLNFNFAGEFVNKL